MQTPLEKLIDDLSDAGNANFLVSSIGDRIMYQFDRKKWRYFDGGRWKLEQRGEVIRMTEDVVRQMIREAADYDDKAAVKRLLSHAHNSLNKKKFEAILGMAEAKLPVQQRDFDQNDDVIGVGNGIVDLKTGVFRVAMRSDMLTRSCGADYVPDAECPRFLAFLEQISPAIAS